MQRRARQDRRGFTILELMIATLVFAFVCFAAAQALEMANQIERTRRAMADQQPSARRVIGQYAETDPSTYPALNATATVVMDSVTVAVTRVSNSQLTNIPRLRFVMQAQRAATAPRPDTVTLDLHPLVTRGQVYNAALANFYYGDRRP